MEDKLVSGAIGVFDSGYGGLTILEGLRAALPQYDYIYLGDNARAPYGVRSFEIVYRFTIEAVQYLFGQGCPLVILGCNTASAKALRTIQQNDLPSMADPTRRVLGVIRPTVEKLGEISRSGHIRHPRHDSQSFLRHGGSQTLPGLFRYGPCLPDVGSPCRKS